MKVRKISALLTIVFMSMMGGAYISTRIYIAQQSNWRSEISDGDVSTSSVWDFASLSPQSSSSPPPSASKKKNEEGSIDSVSSGPLPGDLHLSNAQQKHLLAHPSGQKDNKSQGDGADLLHRVESQLPPREQQEQLRQEGVLDGPIIIGGSGGSGTRAVARMFLELGVYIVVDDHNTWDVDEGFWVDAERMLLPHTHGFEYTLDQVPDATKRFIMDKIKHLSDRLLGRAKNEAANTKRTVWGFKAPCSQVFIPFFHAIFPRMKFVQAMRDGRDIALSSNGEQQRYIGFIPSALFADSDTTARKVRLWVLLNKQARAAALNLNIPFMTVRVEDLAAGTMNQSLSLLQQVRHFIGLPPLPVPDACCLLGLLGSSLGSFDSQALNSKVESRFGKWRRLPRTFQDHLYQAVVEGLRLFGYIESEAGGQYLSAEQLEEARDSPFCQKKPDNKESCPPLLPAPYSDLAAVASAEGCELHPRAIIIGSVVHYSDQGLVRNANVVAKSPQECCQLCRASRGCNVFEFVYTDRSCKMVSLYPDGRTVRENHFATGGSVIKVSPNYPGNNNNNNPPAGVRQSSRGHDIRDLVKNNINSISGGKGPGVPVPNRAVVDHAAILRLARMQQMKKTR